MAGNKDIIEKLEFEKRKRNNVLEYGNDISNYVERMSLKQNVLQQNTYVIISYYTAEFGGEINNYSKEEIDNISFSELYTRAQTVVRSLAAAEVMGRILNSEELAELLYVAYNRDDSEIMQLKRTLDAGYDSLYVTAPDLMKKKMEKIEQEVEEEAVALATQSILEADKIRTMEIAKQQRIEDRALEVIDAYKDEMDVDLYEETKRQIKNKNDNKKSEQNQIKKSIEKPKKSRKKV